MTDSEHVVELPVVRVTLLEDRGQVERRGEIGLPAGICRLRLTGVSPLAVDRSLKVELSGALPVEARLVRAWRERPKGGLPADASALRRRVREMEDAVTAASARVTRAEASHRIVEEAQADVVRAVAEAAGAGNRDASWSELLDRARDAAGLSRSALREAHRALVQARSRLGEAEGALAAAEEPEAFLDAAIEIVADVERAGPVHVGAAYLLPCALWRPCYRASLLGEEGERRIELTGQAVIWQQTGEAWRDVELVLSTARPSLGAEPPRLSADWITLRDKSAEEKKTVEVEVREEEIQVAGGGGAARVDELPGVDDGGEVRTFVAPDRATLPSDGRPTRIDLFRFSAAATAERVAVPELSPLVNWLVRFENGSGRVMLAGPVDLVRESGFVGRCLLKYTGLGEQVKLGFGSEDTVRLVRRVEEDRREAAITGKRTLTRRVRIHVSNAGAARAKVALEERIPVSEIAAVEVKLLPECNPPEPSPDGIVRFELDLAGHERREIVYAYQMVAGAKVVGI